MLVIFCWSSSWKSRKKRHAIPQKTQFKKTERTLSMYFIDKIEKSNIGNAEVEILSAGNYQLT